jgi:hypothetical protein
MVLIESDVDELVVLELYFFLSVSMLCFRKDIEQGVSTDFKIGFGKLRI